MSLTTKITADYSRVALNYVDVDPVAVFVVNFIAIMCVSRHLETDLTLRN